MTESQALDLLVEHKAEVLAATAWEGFVSGGRGFMVCDGQNVGYFTENFVTLFPLILRKRVQRLVRTYETEKEIVVLLAVPFEGRIMLAVGKRTPALTPEECFLKHAGTPGCPPMRTVRFPVAEEAA